MIRISFVAIFFFVSYSHQDIWAKAQWVVLHTLFEIHHWARLKECRRSANNRQKQERDVFNHSNVLVDTILLLHIEMYIHLAQSKWKAKYLLVDQLCQQDTTDCRFEPPLNSHFLVRTTDRSVWIIFFFTTTILKTQQQEKRQ